MQSIAEALVAARREARILAAFPGPLPVDLATAYDIQHDAIRVDGRRLAGWKVAMLRPEFRPRYGEERMAGPIFADTLQEVEDGGGVEVAVFDGGFAALEAEFVVRMGDDLAAPGASFTAADVGKAVLSLHVGLEVASSPLAGLNDLGPGAAVADQGANAGAVVGPSVGGWQTRPLEDLRSRMLIDGVVAGEGSAANVPGGPLAAVAFLANHLVRRGGGLRAGDVVLTGMTTGIHLVRPGGSARVEFPGIAAIDISVVARRPPAPADAR